MDRSPLFAQFDGDEVDGKRYALGDELAESTDAGTTQYLVTTGRFAQTKPGEPSVRIDASRDVMAMSRMELLAELGAGMSDQELRDTVDMKREREADRGDGAPMSDNMTGGGTPTPAATGGEPDPVAEYDGLKGKPLGSLKTAELELIAKAEGVDLKDATTNPDRVKAIEEKRKG